MNKIFVRVLTARPQLELIAQSTEKRNVNPAQTETFYQISCVHKPRVQLRQEYFIANETSINQALMIVCVQNFT